MKAEHVKNTSQQRRRCLHIREKKSIGTKNGNETPHAPEKNRGEPGKKACKFGRREDNHENGKKQFIYVMNIKSNGKSRIYVSAQNEQKICGFGCRPTQNNYE